MDLSQVSKVFLVNLDRRADRLATFNRKMEEAKFPLPIQRVRAVDGSKCQVPRWYRGGEGAWGCARSHLRILEDAQQDDLKNLMVLEDDAYFFNPETAVADIEHFLSVVPSDWEMLMLGGQTMGDQKPVKEGVIQAVNCQRTHAYLVRGRAIGDLYALWSNTSSHIDWVFPTFMQTHKVYCGDPFVVGQDEGKSDINGADNPKKLWRAPRTAPPVYWFKNTGRPLIEEARGMGFHFGRRRDVKGEDVGLAPIWRDLNQRSRETKLREWLKVIDWESASVPGVGTAIWSADADEQLITLICGERLVILDNPTIEQAVAALQEHGGSA